MGCKDTKAISLPLPGYPQNRGSLVHSQKRLLHEVQIKGRSAESVPVRVSPQRRLARFAGHGKIVSPSAAGYSVFKVPWQQNITS